MQTIDIVAQAFGILGMIFAIFSFQNKGNKGFFIMQALSGLSFAANYFLIGAVAAGLSNWQSCFVFIHFVPRIQLLFTCGETGCRYCSLY